MFQYLFDADDSVAELKALDSLFNGAFSTQIQEKVETEGLQFALTRIKALKSRSNEIGNQLLIVYI